MLFLFFFIKVRNPLFLKGGSDIKEGELFVYADDTDSMNDDMK